jgi:hypothetical protein
MYPAAAAGVKLCCGRSLIDFDANPNQSRTRTLNSLTHQALDGVADHNMYPVPTESDAAAAAADAAKATTALVMTNDDAAAPTAAAVVVSVDELIEKVDKLLVTPLLSLPSSNSQAAYEKQVGIVL